MSDQTKINKIHEWKNKAIEAGNSGYLHNRDLSLKEALLVIEKLSPQNKVALDNELYFERMVLGESYFQKNQFRECIGHLERVKTLPEYKNLGLEDKCKLNWLLSHSKLIVALNAESRALISEVKYINQKLGSNLSNINEQAIKEGIVNDQKLIEASECDEIKTIVEFEVPFPIIVKNQPISFDFNGVKHIIEIQLVENPSSPMKATGSNFVEVVEDKYGIANKSKVKLTISKFVDPYKILKMNILAMDNTVRKVFLESIKVMNYFIERFRVISGNYWLETIFHKLIPSYSCKIIAGSDEIINIPWSVNQMFCSRPEPPWITDQEFLEFGKSLNQDLELWKSLLLDAKDYLLRRNYRESIYSINGALENFLYEKTRERLKTALTEDEVEEFLEGQSNYDEFYLKDYMDRDSFDRAVAANVLAAFPPSVYQILGKCHDLVPFPIGKKRVNSLVYKIKKRRNDVIHGREIHGDVEEDAKLAIESFEKLADLFN